MKVTQNCGSPDPIDMELSSWKTVDIPMETNDRLVAAMRSGWESTHEWSTSADESPPLASLEDSRGHGSRKATWLIAMGTLLGTAASLGVVLFVVLGDGSVYAQAIAAIAKARSIHAVLRHYDDEGNLTPRAAELWYDAEKGVREQEERGEVVFTRIDNGKHEWVFRAAANTVVKGPSRDPIGKIKGALKPIQMIESHGGEFDASVIPPSDLVNCRAYVSHHGKEPLRSRSVCWIDDQQRLMRYLEYRLRLGQWVRNERIDLTYDVPIGPERFVAEFGDARLIDRTVPVPQFAMDHGVAFAEKIGIAIGIHDVRRIKNNIVFVMSTSRPADEVIRRVGKVDSKRYGNNAVHGHYQWGSNGRRLPDHTWQEGVQPIEVASWTCGGVEYHWVLLLHASRMLKEDSTMPIGLHLYTRGKWQQLLKDEGKPWMMSQATDVLTMPVPESTDSLDDVLEDVYQQILTMGDQTREGSPVLNMGSQKWGEERIAIEIAGGVPEDEARRMSTQLQGRAYDTSLEQWKAAVKASITEALNQ
ncbi:hypothetical protein [Neorhodopirellula lusitana]|uniref:hypothetical protein n=1 Tax=Neorhodopirellula lusitana TaxID=445327 RepID=UPI00384FD48D